MRKKLLLVFLLVVFSAAVCFAGGEQETTKEGERNVLTISGNQEFGTVDPHRGTDYTEAMAMVNMYDALVFPDGEGVMHPKLAESWTASEDGLTYTFELKQGIKFHDGSEVMADDVVYSVERSLALQEGYSWLWADMIKDVRKNNDYSVTMTLTQPFAPFVSTLAWLFICNKDLVMEKEQDGDWGADWLSTTTTEDAGSGPYMLKSWDRGREIVFERFTGYHEGWPKGDQSIDEVHALLITESSTVRTMLRKGELTVVEHWRTASDYAEMDSYPNASVISFVSPEQLEFKLNCQKAPTDDIHIRKMLAYAFDYKNVTEVLEPGSTPAKGPIPEIIPGHNPNVMQYTMDLDKAREEMEKSKYYPDIPPIELVTVSGLENRRKMALRLQENLAKLGVDLVINQETWGRMTDLATTAETSPHIFVASISANYPDPDSYLYAMYHSKATGTWMSTEWLMNDEIDRLIDAQRKILDKDERQEVLYEIQEKVTDLCPDIFVFVMPLRAGIQDYLKGFVPRPVMSFYYYFHDWWYEK
jgi:peptide/nickel transport system substrate-binding protein